MPDDPNKKKADGKRISQQEHEQAYQRNKGARKSRSKSNTASGSRKKGSK